MQIRCAPGDGDETDSACIVESFENNEIVKDNIDTGDFLSTQKLMFGSLHSDYTSYRELR